MMRIIYLFLLLICISACLHDEPVVAVPSLFQNLPSEVTAITFSNDLEVSVELNPYTYRNFYNGGGVAAGDVNNDGLADLYFSGNQVDNRLYINRGELTFEDVTDSAGLACVGVWSTGVSMVDVDQDGWLDIYVCKAGPPGGKSRHNELFINQKDGTFKEQSAAYGLDITSMSVHSAWLDYDRDGDLDMYLLSNSIRAVGGVDFTPGLRDQYDADGNKLFRNDGGRFVDVTRESGIYSNSINYGLDVAIEDFDLDGWPDIFVSNDFFERDYLYLNEQDGTFREKGQEVFSAMSMGSMGVDVADINGDMIPDLFVTEMLPESIDRQKTKAQYEVWDKYQLAVRNGYHHQFARNMMHLSAGPLKYADVSRLTGTDATEWSWSVLLKDFDNDADIDLHITNGIGRDLLDKDYLNYVANESVISSMIDSSRSTVFLDLVVKMPQSPIANKLFVNDGLGRFSDMARANDMATPTYSNGSVAADLDNDGDLDLVTSNIDAEASVFKNLSDADTTNHYLQVRPLGRDGGEAVGAVVTVSTDRGTFRQMLSASAGFQSGYVGPLHFGLGAAQAVESVHVLWPDGSCQSISESIEIDQRLDIHQQSTDACTHPVEVVERPAVAGLPYQHKEPRASHFVKERLITHMYGHTGPALLHLDDDRLYVGGGKNQASVIIDATTGRVIEEIVGTLASEVTDAAVVDVDGDGDLDIYEAHGGKLFSPGATALRDAVLINDGGTYRSQELPDMPAISTSSVRVADINGDGLDDLIIAESQKIKRYGLPAGIHLYEQKAPGSFTYSQPAGWDRIGMVTDIAVEDIDGDSDLDIIAVGHWMPITMLVNSDKGWTRRYVPESVGLWNCITTIPLTNDNGIDLILGNQGRNSVYEAGVRLQLADLDNNSTIEQIISKEVDGRRYSIQDLDELFSQLPILRKRFVTYEAASKATIEEMFGPEIDDAMTSELTMVESAHLSIDNGVASLKALPASLQHSSIHAVTLCDDQGEPTLYLGGNHYRVKPQFGRDDASFAWALRLDQKADSIYFHTPEVLGIEGQIRDIHCIDDRVIFGINDDVLKVINEVR